MTITIDRYRRAEGLLRATTNASTSDLILTIIAARIQVDKGNRGDGGQHFMVADNDMIDLDELARASGRQREDVYPWLQDADDQSLRDLGFRLFDSPILPRAARGEIRGAVAGLSRTFVDIIEGRTVRRVRGEDLLFTSADAATRRGLDMITAAARRCAAATFLYRVSAAMADLQIGRLVEDLNRRQGTAPVFLGGGDKAVRSSSSAPVYSLIGAAVTALLHADPNGILVLPHVDEATPANADRTELDEWEEPVAATPPVTTAPTLKGFLRVVSHIEMTIVLAVPEALKLDPAGAAAFAGAFGPYRLDRPSALKAIVATSPGGILTNVQADQLLDVVGDPIYAGEVLRTAAAIAAGGGCVRNGPSPKLAAEITSGQRDVAGPRSPSRRLKIEAKEQRCRYNSIVDELASSLIGHVDRPAALRDAATAPFIAELFVSDPEPSFLFERAALLYETGARIIVAGTSASGKSALVAELGRRMGIQTRQHSAATLFARGWGRAEKNIEAAVAAGRGCLTFFDEADALMGSRFDGTDHNSHLTLAATSAFLTVIQDAVLCSPIVIATNRLEAIDPAIRRRADLVLTTMPLPKAREMIAWDKLLNMSPPDRWQPLGGTVPGDYVKAARAMALLGQQDPATAAVCIQRARDDRSNELLSREAKRIGFF